MAATETIHQSQCITPRRPWVALGNGVLLIGFCLAAAGGCFDFSFPYPRIPIQEAHAWFCIGFAALLVALDREPELRRRVLLTAACFGGTLLLAYAMRHGVRVVTELKGKGYLDTKWSKTRTPFHDLFIPPRAPNFHLAPYLWASALWLASPILMWHGRLARDSESRARRPCHYSRPLRICVWALVVYGSLCLASGAASQDPAQSFSLFYRERAIPFAMIFAWLRAVQGAPGLRAVTARCVTWLLVALMLLGSLAGGAYLFGPESLRKNLIAHELIRQETAPQSERTIPVRRLEYPMLHFNRTAYLALIAVMALLVAQFKCGMRHAECGMKENAGRGMRNAECGMKDNAEGGARSAEKEEESAGGGRFDFSPRSALRAPLFWLAPAFFVMILSFTRGVTAAAVAGLCVWAALVSRRSLALIAAACLVVAVAMPAKQRAHYLSIFNPSTYRINPAAGLTSMNLRLFGWQYGLGVVGRMPLAGMGYGTKIVRTDYNRYVVAHAAYFRKTNDVNYHQIDDNANHQHLHNLWLEIAAESGVPALLAFVVFTLTRWWMLGRAFIGSRGVWRRRVAALIAFELSLAIAGTIYYMLKQNFGMINFFVWAFVISELDWMRGNGEMRITERTEAPLRGAMKGD